MIDLGLWASERYRVPEEAGKPVPDAESSEDT